MATAPDTGIVVPDVVGEIVGYRAWKVVGPERFPMLYSVTYGEKVWHTNQWTVADCRGEPVCHRGSDDGRVPGERCSCGMYAAASLDQLVKLGYGRYHDGEQVKVLGQVGFAGKVIPGDQGWRAEKGRIVRLYVPYCEPYLVEPLAELYGVPVELANTFTINERK